MIKYGFFDAKMNDSGEPDRIYDSDDINRFFEGVLTSGIVSGYMNAFRVVAADGMKVSVETGKALLNNHWITSDETEYIDISQSHPTKDRYTRIVIRYDKSSRSIVFAALDGEASDAPTAPEMTQTDDIYEIPLADILISAGSNRIDNITDKREYTHILPAAARVNYRRYEYKHTGAVKEIKIPDAYSYNIDTNLQVYANGLLIPTTEYAVNLDDTSSGYKIVLSNTMNSDAEISIVMIS